MAFFILLLIAIFGLSWRCLSFSLIPSNTYLVSHMFVGFLLIGDFVYTECQQLLDIELGFIFISSEYSKSLFLKASTKQKQNVGNKKNLVAPSLLLAKSGYNEFCLFLCLLNHFSFHFLQTLVVFSSPFLLQYDIHLFCALSCTILYNLKEIYPKIRENTWILKVQKLNFTLLIII